MFYKKALVTTELITGEMIYMFVCVCVFNEIADADLKLLNVIVFSQWAE